MKGEDFLSRERVFKVPTQVRVLVKERKSVQRLREEKEHSHRMKNKTLSVLIKFYRTTILVDIDIG